MLDKLILHGHRVSAHAVLAVAFSRLEGKRPASTSVGKQEPRRAFCSSTPPGQKESAAVSHRGATFLPQEPCLPPFLGGSFLSGDGSNADK